MERERFGDKDTRKQVTGSKKMKEKSHLFKVTTMVGLTEELNEYKITSGWREPAAIIYNVPVWKFPFTAVCSHFFS